MQEALSDQEIFQLSIVIPLYNEAQVIAALCKEIESFRSKLPRKTQIIFVDDGSDDATLQLLRKNPIRKRLSVTILSLSRNFGHQAALLAGMRAARGVVTVTMDGDLQHPVGMIPAMLAQHNQGIDIVQTSRVDDAPTHTPKRITSTLFYWLFSRLSQTNIEPYCSDFRSMNRRSLDALLSMDEQRKFLRGMVQWIGFSSITLPYKAGNRFGGKSKYSWKKMIYLSVVGMTSFSTLPLYLSVLFCVMFVLASLIYAGYVVYVRFVLQTALDGWTSLILVLLLGSSSLFLVLSLYGIYLSAIYHEVKRRPPYVIADIF